MSDSQPPNPPAPGPRFEVPDLELEPVPRSLRRAAPPAARPEPPSAVPKSASSVQEQLFGSSFDFGDDLEDLEFERGAHPSVQLAAERVPLQATATKRAQPAPSEAAAPWPSGRAPDPEELDLDPRELAIL